MGGAPVYAGPAPAQAAEPVPGLKSTRQPADGERCPAGGRRCGARRRGDATHDGQSPIVPEFNSWLEELVKGNGSDLHVKVGSPPMLRLPYGLERLDRDPLSPDRDPGDRRRRHPGGSQGAVQGARRGRLRLLRRQRGPVPRERLPPARLHLDGAAEAALRRAVVRGDRAARVGQDARRRAPRPDPGDGPDGLGQDDDACRDDRLHQRAPSPCTSSRSRTRSRCCTRTTWPRSTSARSARTRATSCRRSARRCGRTPT